MIVACLLQWLTKSILRAAGRKPMQEIQLPGKPVSGPLTSIRPCGQHEFNTDLCVRDAVLPPKRSRFGAPSATPLLSVVAACDRTLQVAGGQGGVSARTTPMRSSTILEYDSNR